MTHNEAALRALRQAYDLASAQNLTLGKALTEARRQVHALEDHIATVDVPAGSLRVVGRLVVMPGGNIAVVAEGRPVRIAVAQGWDFGLPTGTVVIAEAHLQPRVG